jgi:YHS domain-containing protein
MTVQDPVCGRELDPAIIDQPTTKVFGGANQTDPSRGTKRFHGGHWYYFCSLICRQHFISDPDRYLNQKT